MHEPIVVISLPFELMYKVIFMLMCAIYKVQMRRVSCHTCWALHPVAGWSQSKAMRVRNKMPKQLDVGARKENRQKRAWQPLSMISSRSTATSAEEDGARIFGIETYDRRRRRLDEALAACGIDSEELHSPGAPTTATRLYRSFTLPKSAGALAVAEMPARAATVAAQIAYALRENAALDEAWAIRNIDGKKNVSCTRFNDPFAASVVFVLDGLRSAENVGSIFRTADALGAAVLTLNTTPKPPQRGVLKAACGAAESVAHAHFASGVDALSKLKEVGFTIWAAETTQHSINFVDAELTQEARIAIVLGNELVGVAPALLAEADVVVEIPMSGEKNSLNVAVAAGILGFHATRKVPLFQHSERSLFLIK